MSVEFRSPSSRSSSTRSPSGDSCPEDLSQRAADRPQREKRRRRRSRARRRRRASGESPRCDRAGSPRNPETYDLRLAMWFELAEELDVQSRRSVAAVVLSVQPSVGVEVLEARDVKTPPQCSQRSGRLFVPSVLASVLLERGDSFRIWLEAHEPGSADLMVAPPSRWQEDSGRCPQGALRPSVDAAGLLPLIEVEVRPWGGGTLQDEPTSRVSEDAWPDPIDPRRDPWMQMWNELHDALVDVEGEPGAEALGPVASRARVVGVQPQTGIWLLPEEVRGARDNLPEDPVLAKSPFAAQIFEPDDAFCIRNDRSLPWWRDASRRTLQLSCTDRVRALQFHHSYQRRILGTAVPQAMARFTWRIDSTCRP